MNVTHRMLYAIVLFSSTIFLSGCNETDADSDTVDVTEAFLTDFPLSLDYVSIEITDPEIVDGVEVENGVIRLVVPYIASYISDESNAFAKNNLSLESVTFDEGKFSISPEVDSRSLFSATLPVTYEITSTIDLERSIHYDVYVEQEEVSADIDVSILGFKFETIFNESTETVLEEDSIVMVTIPVGTDFSTLIPSLLYQGSKVSFRENDGEWIPYSEVGDTFDFKYPNTVEMAISNENESQTKIYQVLVDVTEPILLSENEIILPDANIDSLVGYTHIISWTNQGNHPIQLIFPSLYSEEQVPEEATNSGNHTNIFNLLLYDGVRGLEYIFPGEQGFMSLGIQSDNRYLGSYTTIFELGLSLSTSKRIIEGYYSREDIYDDTFLKVSTTIVN